jgi:hypothetical protein
MRESVNEESVGGGLQEGLEVTVSNSFFDDQTLEVAVVRRED